MTLSTNAPTSGERHVTRTINVRAGRDRVLGQVRPGAAADTTLYTPPANFRGYVNTIVVCNTGAATFFRIHHRLAGAGAAVGNALFYDYPIEAANTVGSTPTLVIGPATENSWPVANGDIISVYATLATLTFTIHGYERESAA